MSTVVNKIETILKSSYNTKNYVELISEIFPKVNFIAPDKFRKEFTNFSSHIEGSVHVGNYKSPDKKNLIILAVQLKKAGYVENSRSTQRSYAKKLIENANADAAFIAFYTEGDSKWRLSFVRLDYEMKIENGRLKTKENMTPAKRYSYLVGENEPCHTAISRFEQFIIDGNIDTEHPTLDDLENAFSVEKVTNEFFEQYREKYYQLCESLEANEDFQIEAEQHNYTAQQFAKKLMGQIVFLYFLQKKGWLGVGAWPTTLSEKEYNKAFYARGAKSRELVPIVYRPVGDGTYKVSSVGLNSISDEDEAVLASCVKGKPWGSGPHNFMRKLFEIAEKKKLKFFDDLLEPLFYDALNVNRGEQGYCPALHCRIPFLSGGLFEPIDGYDWEHNNFDIPNEIFSNASIKGKRDADGILDIFDRYNFTMSEDEPMEREVAIDPEMLGKVFENLLEVKDRKSKGAFYTPREIVHYMCQESLINYLTNTLGINEKDIREFILYGDFMREQDIEKTLKVYDDSGKMHMEFDFNKDLLISEKILSFKNNVNRLKDLDDALKNVRVADPAVGSGAFPLGMLNEIVRARQNISAYMAITMNEYDTRLMYMMERSPRNLKYETIKDCIFAADIEPSAVDIAQLRLWLSLVIDDEINPDAQNWTDGHRNPLPLPNLECNILCGNSLIDEFEGTRLINESDLFGNSEYQIVLNQSRFESIVKTLIEKQNELFRCENTNTKKKLKEEIESLRNMIILSQMEGCDAEKIQRYYEANRKASKPFVLWQLDFARVFQEKGGFDIVIGNPPYVGERKHKDVFVEVQNSTLGKYYLGRMDFFYFFFHLGLDLLREYGVCSLITTNYYLTALGGKVLRSDFKNRADIIELFNFNETKVFNTALGQHNIITSLQKGHTGKCTKSYVSNISGAVTTNELQRMLIDHVGVACTLLSQDDIYDGEENYIRMFGVKNDTNPINSILDKIVSLSTDVLGNICNPLIGLESSLDEVYVLSKAQVEEITQNAPNELKYIKEFFKGSMIHRYHVENETDKYILYLHEKIEDITSLKGIWKYLKKNETAIKGRKGANLRGAYRRGNWWVLNTPRLDMDFSEEKIVTHYRTKSLRFALSSDSWYASRDVYYITKNKTDISLKYILALLNSSLYYHWFYNRGKRKGDTLELYAKPLKEVPIKEVDSIAQQPFIDLVDEIISQKEIGANTDNLEKEIDYLVYKLYELTDDEIAMMESFEMRYGII